ncbi:hypothetical protein IGJ02_002192 [Enterococcus sp. DIV0724b]|uniref:leucine-rich repeat domain-containing protein n=1 Tax=Enterococcus sp. DIV0724b TaxID=2774694 RepID=UPI003D3005F9
MKKEFILLGMVLSLLSSFFLWENRVEGAAINSYFTELDSNGELLSGELDDIKFQIIRPVYQGNYETILNDITDRNGKPFFKKLGETRFTLIGETIFYNNVGTYNNRKLSVKITMLTGLTGLDSNYWMLLDTDCSLRIRTKNSQLSGEGTIQYTLVYSDTKETVPFVAVEMPVSIRNAQGVNGGDRLWSYASFSMRGLIKVYLNNQKEEIAKTKVSQFKASSSGRDLMKVILSESFGPSTPQNYVLLHLNENSGGVVSGLFGTFAYASVYTFFKSSIETPREPTYGTPSIKGEVVSDVFSAKYTIDQALVSTYNRFYPDSFSLILEDKNQLFQSLVPKTIKVTNRQGEDITDKVKIEPVSKSKLKIDISNAVLKELKDENLRIEVSFDELEVKKLLTRYDQKNGSIDIPLTTYNVTKKGSQETVFVVEEGTAQIIPTISASPKKQTVPINTATKELDLETLLTEVKSTIPEDILQYSFSEEKVFDTVKEDSVAVTLTSELLPELKRSIEVPIKVTDDIVTRELFENQTWIIDAINEQLKPKQIDEDIYHSDLVKIKQIMINANQSYNHQHIPNAINYLRNLEVLTLKDLKLTGSLPVEMGKLDRLKQLNLSGNQLSGLIPKSFGKLESLESMDVSNNKLIGSIPKELTTLNKLTAISFMNNQLIAQVPKFRDGFQRFNISGNQVTYNADTIPSFIKSSLAGEAKNTFIDGLKVTIDSFKISDADLTEIKPFDKENPGYFRITLSHKKEAIEESELYDTHLFTIKDSASNKVLYEGLRDESVKIPYKKGIKYTVILDQAELNPNNQYTVLTKIPELKFDKVPENMVFEIPLGINLKSPVKIAGKFSVYDNRDSGNWQLSITTSSLKSEDKELNGEFLYSDGKGTELSIITGQKAPIFTGISDPENEKISIADRWNAKEGLQYRISSSNYIGNYQGTVIWTLEDVPNVE